MYNKKYVKHKLQKFKTTEVVVKFHLHFDEDGQDSTTVGTDFI